MSASTPRPLFVVPDAWIYHPVRFVETWQAMLEAGLAPNRSDNLLKTWAAGREMSALDKAFCGLPVGDDASFVFAVYDQAGFVVDASAMLDELKAAPVADESCSGIPSYLRSSLYVYFGPQAFPSPHDGVHVEGVYVELFPADEDEAAYDVRFKYACSDDVSQDGQGPDLLHDLAQLVRGPVACYAPGEGETLAALDLRVMIDDDPAFAAWNDYLEAPARAALNAVRALADERVEIVHAVEEQVLDEELLETVVAAESRERFYELAGLLEGGVLVEYLGRGPEGAEEVEF